MNVAVVTGARLTELEAVIERGGAAFVAIGEALREIRDTKLYKDTHRTWESYSRERWGWSRDQADRMIAASKVTKLLPPMGGKPVTERVARELTPLADKPEAVVEVWERVTEEHGERPTAKQVRETVRRIAPRDISQAELMRREAVTGIARLKDWRARFGHVRALRDVVEFIDEWLEEQNDETD